MTRRKRKGPGGARPGAGRPSADPRTQRRELRLSPTELAAQERAAAAEQRTWSDWIRAAAELAIARGSTR